MERILTCKDCGSDDFKIYIDSNIGIDGNPVITLQCSECGEDSAESIEQIMFSTVN
jgi:ribosomal protein L33